MQRTPVESSVIQSVGYDPESSILEIQFFNEAVYQYSHVPKDIYVALMSAKSHGNYFDAHIKSASYPWRRIGDNQ